MKMKLAFISILMLVVLSTTWGQTNESPQVQSGLITAGIVLFTSVVGVFINRALKKRGISLPIFHSGLVTYESVDQAVEKLLHHFGVPQSFADYAGDLIANIIVPLNQGDNVELTELARIVVEAASELTSDQFKTLFPKGIVVDELSQSTIRKVLWSVIVNGGSQAVEKIMSRVRAREAK